MKEEVAKQMKFPNGQITYPIIHDCARCDDCGRNVHDFLAPNNLWNAVTGDPNAMLCYDCFCNQADEKFEYKWRMFLSNKFEWRSLICDGKECRVMKKFLVKMEEKKK